MKKFTCTPDRCDCDLDGKTVHIMDDVVLVTAESLHHLARELGLEDSGNWYAAAAQHCLAEGIADWQPPRRQQHRAAQWLQACWRELTHYATNEVRA